MLRTPREALLAGLVVIVGLVIGGFLGFRARADRHPPLVAAARVTPAPSARTAAPRRTAAPAASAAPTATADAASPAPSAPPPPAGTWRIVETNTSVGTIAWDGTATRSGDALAFDVRKVDVAGRAVGPCERATHLRATVGATAVAPYEETNCSGAVSQGEMRIAWRSPDGRSLRGAFWRNGAKLGDFTATGS